MKRTFIRRFTSAIIALSMIFVPMPAGTFAAEPDIGTPGTSVTNIDTEANSESGGGKIFQSGDNNGEGWFPCRNNCTL